MRTATPAGFKWQANGPDSPRSVHSIGWRLQYINLEYASMNPLITCFPLALFRDCQGAVPASVTNTRAPGLLKNLQIRYHDRKFVSGHSDTFRARKT